MTDRCSNQEHFNRAFDEKRWGGDCPCRIESLEADNQRLCEKGAYFAAEFMENWSKGRLSIDAFNACKGFDALLNKEKQE